MKRIVLMSVIALMAIFSSNKASAIFGIHLDIAVSSRAYWDGKGCTPREKGGCVHIGASTKAELSGTLNNENGRISLIFPESVLKNDTYSPLFAGGTFSIGEITIDPNLLKEIKYEGLNSFQDKKYKYTIIDGQIIILLN